MEVGAHKLSFLGPKGSDDTKSVCVWKVKVNAACIRQKIMAPQRPGLQNDAVDDKSVADSSTQRPSDLCQDPAVPLQVQHPSKHDRRNILLLA